MRFRLSEFSRFAMALLAGLLVEVTPPVGAQEAPRLQGEAGGAVQHTTRHAHR